MLRSIGLPEILIISVIGVIFAVTALIPYWKIFGKAGFSPWLAVLMIIPLVNVIVLWVVAFFPWNVAPAAPPAMPSFSPSSCTKCGRALVPGAAYCAFCGNGRS